MGKNLNRKGYKRWNGKKFHKIFRHLALHSAVVVYIIIGALVFQTLEQSSEISKLKSLIEKVEDQRWKIVKHFDVCSQNPMKCNQLLDEYETAVSEASQEGVNFPLKNDAQLISKWSFPESAFFASTVLTTIGYGNTVPKTFWGRLFCILFAFVGIPLTLTVIADLGVIMATAFSALHRKAKTFFPKKDFLFLLSPTESRWIPPVIGILFFVFYLSAGAIIFMIWEDEWGFFEGFYFCFITMTTIGFGDFVPKSPNYVFMCTFYILVGLALTSTIIELVRRQYARSWKTIQALGGPFAEMLKRMSEVSGPGIDFRMMQNDLKKMLTVMNVLKKTGDCKEWQEAMDCALRDIAFKSKEKKVPQVVQIVVYESTV